MVPLKGVGATHEELATLSLALDGIGGGLQLLEAPARLESALVVWYGGFERGSRFECGGTRTHHQAYRSHTRGADGAAHDSARTEHGTEGRRVRPRERAAHPTCRADAKVESAPLAVQGGLSTTLALPLAVVWRW